MKDLIDIREVVRRTGLTSRALRFYEARGLVAPLRTHTGRRLYGPAELERIAQILALKRADLSLAQIQRLTASRALDLNRLINAQLEALADREAEIAEAKKLLLAVKSRIDRGEPVDAATFCSLIRQGDKIMEAEDWKNVTDRYFSEEEQAQWKEHPAPASFDQHEYSRKWADLGARVQAAISQGPDCDEAQALYDEWQALLAPFKAVATPQMMAGANKLYERMDEWQGDVPQAPFAPEAFGFIQEIGRRRKEKA